MNKALKKELLALVVSLAVLAALLAGMTHLVTPKQHDFGAMWGHFLQEEPDSIDVMFFGSSITYCDVVPAVYWEQSGLTAFVHAGPEQTLPMTALYLRESLKTQSPQAVFVECTGVAFPQYMGYTKTNIGQMPWGWNRLHATFTCAEPEVRKGLLFPLYFYHDRWDSLTENDLQPYDKDMLAGYTFLHEYSGRWRANTEQLVIEPADWERNTAALEEICALCREQDITLVLYRAPVERLANEDWARLEAQFSDRDGVYLLDGNDYLDRIDAVPVTDYYDTMHYNASGAAKFSSFLGEWSRENLGLTPLPGQDEALWTERLAYFEELAAAPMQPKA